MKNSNKKVYTLRGSEDGVIGVYTNKKLAFEAAMEYCADQGHYVDDTQVMDIIVNNKTKRVKATYSRFCKDMNKLRSVDISLGRINSYTVEHSCEVQEFYLND